MCTPWGQRVLHNRAVGNIVLYYQYGKSSSSFSFLKTLWLAASAGDSGAVRVPWKE